MDDKREFLMEQLFGRSNFNAQNNAQNLQRLARAQEKSQRLEALFDDQDAAANALRRFMNKP